MLVGLCANHLALAEPYLASRGGTASGTNYFGPSGYDKMNGIKAEIANLLELNQELESQYNVLTAEKDILQKKVNQHVKKFGKITRAAVRTLDSQKIQGLTAEGLKQDLEKMQHEILIKESRAAYLSGNLLDFEEKQRLLELQLEQLRLEKNELDMENKLAEYLYLESERGQSLDVVELEVQLRRNLEKVEELNHAVGQLEDIEQSVFPTIERLKKEISGLEEQLSDLHHRMAFKEKENAYFKNRKLLLTRKAESVVWEKEREKVKIELKANKLETQYQHLSNKVTSSLQSREQKHELMQNIIAMDKENQILREEISHLEEKIGEHGHIE